MKRNIIKRLNGLLIVAFLINAFSFSDLLQVTGEQYSNDYYYKASEALQTIFDELSEEEKAPVALWIDDIDMSEAVEYAETQSGVSIDEALEHDYTSEEINNFKDVMKMI